MIPLPILFGAAHQCQVKCSVKIGSPWVWDDEWQDLEQPHAACVCFLVMKQSCLVFQVDQNNIIPRVGHMFLIVFRISLTFLPKGLAIPLVGLEDYAEKTPDVTAVGTLVEVKDPKALRARPGAFGLCNFRSFCHHQGTGCFLVAVL